MLSFGGWKDPGCRERSRVGSVPAYDWAHYCLCQACAKQCVARRGSVIHSVAFQIPFSWQISCVGTHSHPVVLHMLLLLLNFAGHSHRPPSSGPSLHAKDEPGDATGFLAPLFGLMHVSCSPQEFLLPAKSSSQTPDDLSLKQGLSRASSNQQPQ